jgi:pimeloyl-ACP methyl ester carboxylesterase
MIRLLKGKIMTSRDPSRRDLLAGGALAGAAALVGAAAPAVAQTAGRRVDLPPADPNPFKAPPLPPALTAPSAVAKLDGVNIWYWDTGGPGEVVVLQHAMTGSGHVWGYQQQAFRDAGYRVIGYSRRSYRETTSPNPGAGNAVEDMRMLMDHLKVDKCHVIGTAGGGLLAAGWALHHPNRTHTITIAHSVVLLGAPELTPYFTTWGQPWQANVPHDYNELSPSYRALAKEGWAMWKDLAHKAREQQKGLPSQPYGGPNSMADLARITAPTLLIYGDADPGSTPPLGRLFNRTIPGSEFVMFTECGHSGYWERPDMFNAVVLDFMKRRTTA